VAELWKNKSDSGLSGVHLIREMPMYGSSFQEFELVFARKGSNKAAHLCAKESSCVGVFRFRF
jgi:hypothetical protein